jgi:methylated-DNA-[protein]-cysteine S-methyltransferase
LKTPLSILDRESYTSNANARYGVIDTELGPVSFAADKESLLEVHYGGGPRIDARLTSVGRDARRQISDYLGGKRREFDLPLAMAVPPFTARVLAEVEAIPFGETLSYGEVADAIGSPKAARAVGQAVGSNPLPIVIPCHRVLAAHGRLGGFGGGLDWKRFLLALESIRWRD